MASSEFIGWFGGGAPWSWNGTTAALTGSLSVSGQVLSGDGLVGAPGHSFINETTSGLFRAGASDVRWSVAGSTYIRCTASTVYINNGNINIGGDVDLQRSSANRLRLVTGDVFNLQPTAFASLPAGVEGDVAWISDSSTAVWGASISGGGANKVLGVYNGTNWTVAGK